MSVLSIRYESYFMDMVYSGRSLQDILDEGAKILGTPIRFSPENRIEYAICSSGYPKEDIDYIINLLEGEGRKLHIFLGMSKREKPEKPFLFYSKTSGKPKIYCNILIGSRYFGNLSIPQADVDLKTVDMDMVLLISRTIALSCAVTGTWGYDISRDSLLQRILSGMIGSREEILAYMDSSAELEGKRWKLVCARIAEGKEPVIFRTALQRGFPGNLVVVHGRMTVMLVDVTREDLKPRQLEELRNVAATYDCALGISTAFDDILECREQMRCLAEHPKMIRGDVGLFDYADDMEYLLFYASRLSKEKMISLICGKLMEIRQYDRENGTGYFDTIRTYLDCSYHVQRTAEAMHTHKNTVLYRITRIQEMFGVDLHSNRDIYALNLALSALRYWGKE